MRLLFIIICIEYYLSVGVCGNSNQSEQRVDKTEEKSEEKDRDLDKTVSRVKQSCETRLTFHSGLEVPQLRQWFRSNPKPSDPILLKYAEHLNQSPLRQERYQNFTRNDF